MDKEFYYSLLNASTSQADLVAGIFIIGTLIGRLFIGRMINSTIPKTIINLINIH